MTIPHSGSDLIAADFAYVGGIIERNHIGPGPLTAALREFLRARYARRHVVFADSGTAALHLCLLALKERFPGRNSVLTGAYVCPEVIGAILQAGLIPVFADSRAESLNMDMNSAADRIDGKSLAVICTNIGGMPDDYGAASSLGVPVISDCAQAVGARFGGRELVGEGLCSILSFGPTKMITAGAGGAFLSNDAELGRAVADLSVTEMSAEQYRSSGFRVTFGQHFGDLAAGLAAAQLKRLDSMMARRRLLAESYERALRERAGVQLVDEVELVFSNRFRYYFVSDQAESWVKHLQSTGIDARRSISHVIPEYLDDLRSCPQLVRLRQRVVSIPIYPALTPLQASTIVNALKSGPGGK